MLSQWGKKYRGVLGPSGDIWARSCQGTCEHRSSKTVASRWLRLESFTASRCTHPFCFKATLSHRREQLAMLLPVRSKQLQNIYACWQREIRCGGSGFTRVERSVPEVCFPLQPPSQGRWKIWEIRLDMRLLTDHQCFYLQTSLCPVQSTRKHTET